MHWRLTIEDFWPELIYLPRDKNIITNFLSRIHLQNFKQNYSLSSAYACAENFVLDKNDRPSHAHIFLSYNTIIKHQQNDADLVNMDKTDSTYVLTNFLRARSVLKLKLLNGKIIIPKTLQKHLVQWYQMFLCHPSETRIEQTTHKHFTWECTWIVSYIPNHQSKKSKVW